MKRNYYLHANGKISSSEGEPCPKAIELNGQVERKLSFDEAIDYAFHYVIVNY